ncbi:MAG: Peptidase family [Deltaproteobacteria bacterium]|nr:Peptidase family [Deltaproteobacteria bacterium]
MIYFTADYFDGKTSRAYPVRVAFDGIALVISDNMQDNFYNAQYSSIEIDPALGRTKRSIRLPNGSLLQTNDLEAVNALETATGINRSWNWVHYLETRWRAVVVCMFLIVAALFGLIYYAIPYAANYAAQTIPLQVTSSASKQALRMFDQRFFRPSGLNAGRKQEITSLFGRTISRIDPAYVNNYTIVFRKGMSLGANAFALPSGIVVVTDELIALSDNDDELTAIFAHEINHVKRRHALRSILQSTGVFFLVTLLTGDVTSIANLASFLPALLIENGYSRDFERQADHEAGSLLIGLGKGTGPFQNILQKIDSSHPQTLKLGVFSTHPETVKRIEYLKKLDLASKKQDQSSHGRLPLKNDLCYNGWIPDPWIL